MELLLLIIAWALKLVLSPVLFVYGIIAACIRKDWQYFKGIALAIDCFGNALGKHIFNDLLKSRGGYSFGDHKDTISYALGKNAQLNTLTPFGRFVGNILDAVDPDHLKKSVENNDNK